MTATDETKIAILKASLLNIGRLLPAGMEVFFYREGDDPRVRMQQVMPDGSTIEYAFGGHGPIFTTPTVESHEAGRATYEAYAVIFPPMELPWEELDAIQRDEWASLEERLLVSLAVPMASELTAACAADSSVE